MRVVLDTSVMVAALRSRKGATRVWLTDVLLRKHVALLSVPLVLEYESVLTRPEQLEASQLKREEVDRFLDGFCSVAEHIDIANRWRPILRDPDDEMVLETAVFGEADYLLTFNVKDFAGAAKLQAKVLTPGAALAILMREPP